jgi:hypothetical protein
MASWNHYPHTVVGGGDWVTVSRGEKEIYQIDTVPPPARGRRSPLTATG